jgi:hypothetical protein
MANAHKACWICGGVADTNEHMLKASDIRLHVGKPKRAGPVYYGTDHTKNIPIENDGDDLLTFKKALCANCNNVTTQPYDQSWDQFSRWVKGNETHLKPGSCIDTNAIFSKDIDAQLLRVHLYFAKLIGCALAQSGIRFDMDDISTAIRDGHPCKYVHLKFGVCEAGITCVTNLCTSTYSHNEECAFALWGYSVGKLVVHIMYAAEGEERQGLIDAWHPSQNCTQLKLADFS